MEQIQKKQQYKSEGFQTEDLPYLFRLLRKYFLVIVLSAITVGSLALIASDVLSKTSYTASVMLAVLPRNSHSNQQASINSERAVIKCVNLLNSSTFTEEIKKENEALPGRISVKAVAETNLLNMNASAGSARDALRLLKAGINAYPQIMNFLNYPYLIRQVGTVSADSIRCNVQNYSRLPFLMVAFVLFAGCGMIFLHVIMTDRLHCEKKVEQLVEVPLLGKLSIVKKKKQKESILINRFNHDAGYTEEIDLLTTNIQEKMLKQNAKAFMVTSCTENDGKSTVVSNVAMNLADRGYRVCLVEMDLKKPALIKIFECPSGNKKSIGSVLTGKAVLEEAKFPYKKGLDLYLQYTPVGESDRVLENSQLKELLEQLKSLYHYIILDTPPIGIVRDAELVSSAVDASILVFCQDKIRAAELNDFTDLLENAGSTVVGCVMNKAVASDLLHKEKTIQRYYHRPGNKQ